VPLCDNLCSGQDIYIYIFFVKCQDLFTHRHRRFIVRGLPSPRACVSLLLYTISRCCKIYIYIRRTMNRSPSNRLVCSQTRWHETFIFFFSTNIEDVRSVYKKKKKTFSTVLIAWNTHDVPIYYGTTLFTRKHDDAHR